MNTENHYQETDLGNISLNPRGEYNPEESYEYLDLVVLEGGSYVCLAENGATITGISPESGKTTQYWQVITIPGSLTPEYIAMHDRVVNLSEQVEADAEEVRTAEQNVSGMELNVTQMQEQTRQSAEAAEQSKDSSAGYAASANASRQAAEESEQNINAHITGFDIHVVEKTEEAENDIEAARIAANKAIIAQQEQSVNEVARAGIEAISTAQSAAQTATEKAQAADTSEKNAAASETAAKLSETNATKMAEQVAADKEQVANDRTAVENAKQEMTGSVAQIEQNTQGISELKGDIVDIDDVLNVRHLRKISVTTTGSYERAIAFRGLSLISGHSYTFIVKPVSVTTQEFYLYFVNESGTEKTINTKVDGNILYNFKPTEDMSNVSIKVSSGASTEQTFECSWIEDVGDNEIEKINTRIDKVNNSVSEIQSDLDDSFDRLKTVDGNIHLYQDMFEIGEINISDYGISYQTYNRRVRTKKGITIPVKKGYVISLTDYTDAKIKIGLKNGDGNYNDSGWVTEGAVCCRVDGECVIILSNKTEKVLDSVSELFNLLRINTENNFINDSVEKKFINNISFIGNPIEFEEYDGYLGGSVININSSFSRYYENIGTPGESAEKYTEYFRCYGNGIGVSLRYTTTRDCWVSVSYYDENKEFIERVEIANRILSAFDANVTFLENAKYFRLSYRSYGETKLKFWYQNNVDRLVEKIRSEQVSPFYANVTPNKPRYVQHRGYMSLAPENSLPAFELAGKNGAWGAECDVYETLDGELIIMHDSTIDRTTNGSGECRKLTFEQIRSYRIDTGTNISEYSDEELVVPTFEEYLKICKKYGMVANIEIKNLTDDGIKKLINTIYSYGMQYSVIIIVIKDGLSRIREINNELFTLLIFNTSEFNDDLIEKYKGYKNFAIGTDYDLYKIEEWTRLTRLAQSYGMLVSLYTIKDKETDKKIFDILPDFITTELPAN